jgi:iron complex transport system ATP-binding protein
MTNEEPRDLGSDRHFAPPRPGIKVLIASMPSVVDLTIERHYRLELERPILERIEWRIEEGQHWALVGPNGSGKSTLLSIVSGDLWPSVGVVRVLGGEYGRIDKRELKKRIGVVSSVLAADLPATDLALEVVASGIRALIGRLGPFTEAELERASRALRRVRAMDSAGKRFGVLSQGERQRVMIARALVCEPRLLILDEPCGGLDPVARERFLSDLRHLAGGPDAPTELHVTHHLDEIPPFVTHALVLREGRVVAQGRAPDVLTGEILSQAFGAPCEVERFEAGGPRYRLRVTGE